MAKMRNESNADAATNTHLSVSLGMPPADTARDSGEGGHDRMPAEVRMQVKAPLTQTRGFRNQPLPVPRRFRGKTAPLVDQRLEFQLELVAAGFRVRPTLLGIADQLHGQPLRLLGTAELLARHAFQGGGTLRLRRRPLGDRPLFLFGDR